MIAEESLPPGWALASLLDVSATDVNSITDGPFGSNLKTADYVESGVRVVRLGNIQPGDFENSVHAYVTPEKYAELTKHEIFSGDLVIAALAEPVARCCVVPDHIGRAIVKADCIRFKTHPSTERNWVMHWLNSPLGRAIAEETSHGIGRKRINLGELKGLPIPLPPLAEQRRIVAKLEDLLARARRARAALEAIPALLDRFRQSLLESSFVVQGEVQRSALISLVQPNRGITYGIIQSGPHQPEGVPVVRCGDVKGFDVDVTQLKRTTRDISDAYSRTILEGGEVLIAIRGTVGATAITTPPLIGANVAREIAVIPVDTTKVDPEFLMYQLACPTAQTALGQQVKGVAQQGINLTDLRTLEVVLPSLEEQLKTVVSIRQRLAVIDSCKTFLQQSLDLLTSQEQSILSKAFRGELVPQDPSDEPASVLLERLRADRAAAVADGKKPRGRSPKGAKA